MRKIPVSRSRMGPGFCISNRFAGVADAVGPQTTLEGTRPREEGWAHWRLWRQACWCFPQNLAPPCFYLTKASKGRGSVHLVQEPRREMPGRSCASLGPSWWWQQEPSEKPPRVSFREDSWTGGDFPLWRASAFLFNFSFILLGWGVQDQLQQLSTHGHFLQLYGLFSTDLFIQKCFTTHLQNVSPLFKNIHILFQ